MIDALDKLLKVDDQHQDISYFAPIATSQHSNAYSLFFSIEGEALVVRAIDVLILKRGKAKRIIAANITKRTLTSVTRAKLGKLLPYWRARDVAAMRRAESDLAHFIKHRTDLTPPYFGAMRNDPPAPFRGFGLSAELEVLDYTIPFLKDSTIEPAADREVDPIIESDSDRETGITTSFRPTSEKNSPCIFEEKKFRTIFYYRIVDEITEEDCRLITAWNGNKVSVDISALRNVNSPAYRRISWLVNARMAEKTVIKYLKSCGIAGIMDVSAGQLSAVSGDWKTHDIWAGRPIDVKIQPYSRRTRARHLWTSSKAPLASMSR